VLGGGLAGSTVLQRKGAARLARDFKPGFRIALYGKDMGIVASLKAQGDGGLDHSALLKLVAQLSGRQ
jgi:2-hydroxy-3-oxopropionate reductase